MPIFQQTVDPRRGRGLPRRGAGFSLIELMVVVAVVAILAVVAYPSLTSVINSNRLSSNANELVASLQYARSEAIRRNARVSVCGSSDGATCDGTWTEWLTVLDSDDSILRRAAVRSPVQITADEDSITYRPNGFATAAAITVCIPTASPPENQRVVSVTVAGRVATAAANGGGACP
ncbi:MULTISPECIES: GspH/FimT family pseudopilin [unclassified Luteimonas]